MFHYILILFVVYAIYLIYEKHENERCLASFRGVIHVNGIRGKTSVCRILDAALRQKYRVYTKTTGTTPCVIHTDGTETILHRRGSANIREQMTAIRRAYREGAEIVILECMAVRPELQRICQREIVKSRHTVITNVRYDHIFEMGESLEEIALSLGETIPLAGTLYTAAWEQQSLYRQLCEERGSRLVMAQDNLSLAQSVSADFGISREEFQKSLPNIRIDFGAKEKYDIPRKERKPLPFLNLFSVNDPQSTQFHLEEEKNLYGDIRFLYNHRRDRPDRALLFARHFFPAYPEAVVYLMGDTPSLAKRIFHKNNPGLNIIILNDWKECLSSLPEDTLLIGIGNIKGKAYSMMEYLEKEGRRHE